MSKLQISDLLNTLNVPGPETKLSSKKATKATEQFIVQSNMKVKQIKKSQSAKMKRQMNYKATQQDMDKWIGIVKINREKQTLDLTRKQKDGVKVNFFPSKPVSDLQAKTDKILAELSMQNSSSVMKAEQKQLQKLDPQQAKRRLIQARKHRSMVFYQQIKRRRISKIKSKLYHKIKKRQRMRQEQKRVETMSPHQKSEYMQKLMKDRIKQRISLRHNSKNKHIQNLLRFSKYNKDGVQQAMNEVNLIRQKQLERNVIDEQALGDLQEEYDDQNYRQQAIGDLQRELQAMENEQDEDKEQNLKGLDGMKFMRVAREKQAQKDIDDAYKLINQLENQDSQDIKVDSDEQQDEKTNHHNKNNTSQNAQTKEITRKTYGADTVLNPSAKDENTTTRRQFIKKNITQTLMLGDNIEQLTSGLNVDNLKQKYQPQRVDLKLNEQLLQMSRNIFNSEINPNQTNQAVIQNLKQFQQDRFQNYEQSIEPQKKKLQGWGNWAGPNIKQKAIDPQLQIKKKLAKIQQIKRKRRDGQLTNVIINEVRNKQLKDYMVRKLPHQFTNVEQFEYMNQTELGPEWNTLTQFKANIKPKVINRVGQVIEPVKVPKKFMKA